MDLKMENMGGSSSSSEGDTEEVLSYSERIKMENMGGGSSSSGSSSSDSEGEIEEVLSYSDSDLRTHRAKEFFCGTAPAFTRWTEDRGMSSILAVCECLMRGVGQAVFCNNPFSGLLMTLGMFVEHPGLCLYALIGVTCSSLFAYLLGYDTTALKNGLYGYNGMLTGCAIFAFLVYPEMVDLSFTARFELYLLPLIFLSSFSALIMEALLKLLVPTYGAVPLALPFCIVVILFLTASTGLESRYPAFLGLPDQELESDELRASLFIESLVRGIGKTYFCDSIASGILVAVAIAVYSPLSCGMAFAGAGVASLFALAVGLPTVIDSHGVYGYCSVLSAVSIGGVFFVATRRGVLLALLASFFSVIVQTSFKAMVDPYPVMAFPFCFTGITILLTNKSSAKVAAVKLTAITTPEEHLKKHRKKLMVRFPKAVGIRFPKAVGTKGDWDSVPTSEKF